MTSSIMHEKLRPENADLHFLMVFGDRSFIWFYLKTDTTTGKKKHNKTTTKHVVCLELRVYVCNQICMFHGTSTKSVNTRKRNILERHLLLIRWIIIGTSPIM